MYKNLIRYCFIALALLVVLLLSACSGKTVSGKYVYMWDGILYLDFQNGNYTTNNDDIFGTYIVNKDSVILTPSDDAIIDIDYTTEYKIVDGYLLGDSCSGTIPDDEFFNAICIMEYVDYTDTFYFYDDGSFKNKYATVGATYEGMSGTYERKDEVITLTIEGGGVHYNLLILDNTLYDAYRKEEVSQN